MTKNKMRAAILRALKEEESCHAAGVKEPIVASRPSVVKETAASYNAEGSAVRKEPFLSSTEI